MSDQTRDQDAAAGSADTLNHLLHLGHHEDVATLFDTVTGLDKAELERVVIAAVGVLTDRSVLDRYRAKVGWDRRDRRDRYGIAAVVGVLVAWVAFLAAVAVGVVKP